MSDWAEKVLAGVPRLPINDDADNGYCLPEADALAAIDKLGDAYAKYMGSVMSNAEEMAQQMRAHIAALTAERDYTHGTNEVLRSENQRLEAERDALRAKVARLEGELGYYADQYCEGFCQDLPPGYTDENCERDCGGCKARAALAKIKEQQT